MRVHFPECGPTASCFESSTGGVEFGACSDACALPLKVPIFDFIGLHSLQFTRRQRATIRCLRSYCILFLRNSRLHVFLTFPFTYQIDLHWHKGRGVPSGNIWCIYDETRSENVCVVKATRDGEAQVRLASLEEQKLR